MNPSNNPVFAPSSPQAGANSHLFFFGVGGIEALFARNQLARPENHFLSPKASNRILTTHGTTMILLVVMPMLIEFGIRQTLARGGMYSFKVPWVRRTSAPGNAAANTGAVPTKGPMPSHAQPGDYPDCTNAPHDPHRP